MGLKGGSVPPFLPKSFIDVEGPTRALARVRRTAISSWPTVDHLEGDRLIFAKGRPRAGDGPSGKAVGDGQREH